MPVRTPAGVLAAATGAALVALAVTPASAATVLSGAPAVSQTAPEPVVPVPATGSLTLVGKGFGHGRGMSQHGAANAAARGLTWQQITSFYYPGTVRSAATVAALRVGLADTVGAAVRVAPQQGLRAGDGTTTIPLPATVTVNGAPVAVSRFEVEPAPGSSTATTLQAVTVTGARTALGTAVRWTLASSTGRVTLTDASGRPRNTYLGTISGMRTATAVEPVLATRLDDYVRMVVPAEVYTSWPAQALAAQAVAARTYAVAYLASGRFGGYDICSSTRCQVVGGIGAETESTRLAVAATAGVVLTSGGVPIRAEFSSSNGGYTTDGGVPYLPAQADPYDRGVLNPVGSWSAAVPVERLAAAYPGIGRIRGLQVLSRDGRGELGGRILTAKVLGETGTRTTTGDALRRALGTSVRSTLAAAVAAPSRTAETSPVATTGTSGSPATSAATTSALVAGGVGLALLPRTTTSTGVTTRLMRGVGELDDRPGSDVVSLTSDGRLHLLSSTAGATATAADTVATTTSGADLGDGYGDVTAVLAMDDHNGDRQRDLVIRRGDGRLQRLTSDGASGLVPGAPVTIGTGWGAFRAVTAADLTGDGRDDLLGLLPDGTIRLYPTTGRDVFAPRRVLGVVPGLVDLTSQGDLTGDGVPDLVGVDAHGRVLRLQVSRGSLTAPVVVGRVASGTRLL